MAEKEFSSEKSLFSADLTNDLLFREPIGYSALNDGKLFWQEHKVSNSYDELMAKKAKEEEERKKFLEEEAKRKALFEEEAKKKAEETPKTHLTKEAAMLEKESDSVSKLNENIQKQLAAKREQAAAFRKARLEQIEAERKAEAERKEQQAKEELIAKKKAEEEKKPEKIDNRITSDRINETVNGVSRKPGADHIEINYDRYANDSNVGAEDVARAFKNVMGPVINTASDNNEQYTDDYDEQYENNYDEQYEGQYEDNYDEQHEAQYEENYNEQYETQYEDNYDEQYEGQYEEDYNEQYETQYEDNYNDQYEEQQYYQDNYNDQYEDDTDNYEVQLEKQLQDQLLDDDYNNYMMLRDIVSDRVSYMMNVSETKTQEDSLSLSFDGSIVNNDNGYNQSMYNNDMSYNNDNMSYANSDMTNYGYDNHNNTMLSDILSANNNNQTSYPQNKAEKEGMNGNMFALIVILFGLVVLIGCTVANYNTIIEWIAELGQ
ncbi:MAG: hypothetical protein K6G26_09835 [Lachnospiraceae bacterium]|nr:hypothetical protein [Lachnospiraceae bacterium]